ncbi:LytR/AlgR family response regulator transcription factor [Bowmanella yangjiangensis]|uniref:Response regulator transcription factor n=1 Tax=Bowmanella yangjiangensis TaxID=2811230 RepID=A0ABS3CVZ6_9ALTE|nr:LytTR family DNA-binding domain-containing protein [Bowmanella yangjiangensis]MBN7820495.1 response regulator transcription factor [Bowmanella yangjiangensis]
MVNLIIADDEPILLDSLAVKLGKYWPQANIVAKCQSGEEALDAIQEHDIQVAFLDIQMGDLTGIDVALKAGGQSHFVFVTAYDQYAVSAFETGAIDYLLKPYSDERLQDCIKRVQERLNSQPMDITQTLLNLQGDTRQYLKRIKVQIGTRIWLVAVQDILYFQASGRYVKVVTAEREALVRMPLKTLLLQLDPECFWQIHRSIVINLNHLDHVSASEPEQLQVFMKGVASGLPVSRSSQHLFRSMPSEL